MTAPSPSLAGHEEEKLDRYLFRPLSQPVAVVAAKLGLTPNAVSVLGFLVGAAGGWFFQYKEARLVAWGVGLFCLRNILDYADGQLARMTGKGTKYGYYFDGLCDYGASVSVYAFGIVGIWPDYGFWAIPLAVAAGWSGGFHSALLDFYKMAYKYWALGLDRNRFQPPDEMRAELDEARGFDRVLVRMAIKYSKEQHMLSGYRRRFHERWLRHRDEPAFRERYSRVHRWPLKGWFLVGPNWQSYLFFAFGLMGRMDLYFWTQLIVLNAVCGLVVVWQRAADRRLDLDVAQFQLDPAD